MVVFSSGWGALALVIPGVFLTATLVVCAVFTPFAEPRLWMAGLAFLLSGPIVYAWGRVLNSRQEKAEELALAKPHSNPTLSMAELEAAALRHTLYWIRMETWGLVQLLAGVLFSLLSLAGIDPRLPG